MIPYTRHTITAEDEAAVLRALRSGYLTQGPEVEAFEDELAEFAGARYAVAVNSGTAALHLAYLAAGFGPDKVAVMPAISFVATANAALHCGAHIEFVDFTGETVETWEHIFKTLGTEQTEGRVALVPVTLGGEPRFWDWGTAGPVIVDACHGPMHYWCGMVAPTAMAFSFHPAKFLAAGEGGAIVTNDPQIAERCRLLRSHGRLGSSMVALGYNYRMPELSAALARSQLTRVMEGVKRRRQIASWYDESFCETAAIEPRSPDSWVHLYRLRHPDRDAFRERLAARGVGTAVHYPVIPLQPYYRDRFGYEPGMWPNAEKYAAETVSIPMFPTLTEQEISTVLQAVEECA
jgi:dTDP-4-amino-4,6-dideoxygalactose transaminase